MACGTFVQIPSERRGSSFGVAEEVISINVFCRLHPVVVDIANPPGEISAAMCRNAVNVGD